MNVAFAGSRPLGVQALELLLRSKDINVIALILPGNDHDPELCSRVKEPIKVGSFKETEKILRETTPDYLLSVHFPHIFKPEVLTIPKIGCLNLHPSLLPFNRGRHSYQWAIIDGTPHGATLHWMDEGVDTGDIALQIEIPVYPFDTTHTLYLRTCEVELDLLNIALPRMRDRNLPRKNQGNNGTSHKGKDLDSIKELKDLTLVNKLRALTTLRQEEAAFFEVDGNKFSVRVKIEELKE